MSYQAKTGCFTKVCYLCRTKQQNNSTNNSVELSKDVVTLRGDTQAAAYAPASSVVEDTSINTETVYERLLITLDSEEHITLQDSEEGNPAGCLLEGASSSFQSKESGIASDSSFDAPLIMVDMESNLKSESKDEKESKSKEPSKSQDVVQSSMQQESAQSKDGFLGFKNIVCSKITAMKLKQEEKRLNKIDKDIEQIVTKMHKKRDSLLTTSSSENAKLQEKSHKEVSKAAETVAVLEIDRDAQNMKIGRLKEIIANRASLTDVAKRKFSGDGGTPSATSEAAPTPKVGKGKTPNVNVDNA